MKATPRSWAFAGLVVYGLTAAAADHVPTTFSATRLEQTAAETPDPVTVITASTIRALGLRNIPDALRLVPGMVVAQESGDDYRVAYHGGNAVTPRRILVLLDGVPAYRAGYSQTDWLELPVDMDQIARIEIVRGPAVSVYGSGAFSAVINIVTEAAEDRAPIQARARAQDNGSDALVQVTQHGDSSTASAALSWFQTDGKDRGIADSRHDSLDRMALDLRYDTNVGAGDQLQLWGAYARGTREEEFVHASQLSFPDRDYQDSYLRATWDHEYSATHRADITAALIHVERQQEWNSCLPAFMFLPSLRALDELNPTIALQLWNHQAPTPTTPQELAAVRAVLVELAGLGASAFAPTCGVFDQNYTDQRAELSYTDTLALGDATRLVSRLAVFNSRSNSQTYFQGEVDELEYQAGAHLEQRYGDALVQFGALYEHGRDHDDTSPRINLNYALGEGWTARAGYAVSYRAADMWETRNRWEYTGHDMSANPYGRSTLQAWHVQRGYALDSEEQRSASVGINWQRSTNHADLKIYRDHLSNLIGGPLAWLAWDTTPADAMISGAEFEAGGQIGQLAWGAFYAYEDMDTDHEMEKTLNPMHSGGGWLAYVMGAHSLALSVTSSDNVVRNDGATGARLVYGFNIRQGWDLQAGFEWWPDAQTQVMVISGNRTPQSLDDDSARAFAGLRLVFE